jgi:hypothetical protein
MWWTNYEPKTPGNNDDRNLAVTQLELTLAASRDPAAIRRGPADGSSAVRTADTSCAWNKIPQKFQYMTVTLMEPEIS